MKIRIVAALATLLAGAFPLAAQQVSTPGVQLTPYAGYMRFGNLVSGPAGSGLSNGSAPAYGAELSVPLNRNISVYGNVAYSRPGIEVGLPVVGGISLGDGSVLMYDGGLQLSLPERTAQQVTPFIQAGIGGMRYSFKLGPLDLNASNVTYNIGAGADLPLSPSISLRILAKDYIGRFDAGDIAGLDLDTGTAHNFAFNLGLSLDF